MISDWSLDREPLLFDKSLNELVANPNLRIYATKPTITTANWLRAHQWNNQKKSIIKLNINDEIIYFTPAGTIFYIVN